MTAVIHVAVGVLRDDGGRVLISRRASGVHQGGLWEFPGGKVESGETVTDALARELSEELGISVRSSAPLLEVRHDYGDKQVMLDVHEVTGWSGEPRGLEGQPLAWASLASLDTYAFPAANAPIVAVLRDE